MPQTFMKDSSAVLDYQIDWSDWVGSDTISTSTWTVPSGITKVSDSNTTTTATIWLSGGVPGTSYNLINHITTVGTRQDDRTIMVTIEEK